MKRFTTYWGRRGRGGARGNDRKRSTGGIWGGETGVKITAGTECKKVKGERLKDDWTKLGAIRMN